MSKDLLYLTSISEALERINLYTPEGRSAFLASTLVKDGVIRNLIMIGEAVKNLSADLRESESSTPWKSIAGMRDVLIHDYLRVNLEQVWETVARDLPPPGLTVSSLIERHMND
ncbi:DUF86 domain-containing protein [Synechococcus sp. Cruz-9H2]|uniref:HepT-like ribonuclease domain-containing protein n=1 Tax=unclassified Synechococcus TaxID=2626047 RepID=UPI0020CE86A7|nr:MULTISPECIES: DUF86 domain-containing protein [unclassified Synechococcus]MCP9819390.1 DUF86 domain-containing protein [Synechococcus sp. Cruz-9H2]MCP9843183.1 DUF86 domain-containing protein [Synechococcus sp. Edmonson 11F2]MCP9854928.1 DUF86 domain-containing protein [Synechococcus sp. Cruz-9C9]MCP9862601.1 DUF86 domain-containing protein [Synechococcus sp. Cruz-7E5]MCP9870300.1 DUF86 domain-containing protein [Synechococcus sp. Cruz-7B9]